ncbi:MAG: type II and III secretion system protein [Fuerstiella sp.]|nr:type II and III secretion system protein [Fuerstiella sp.]
MYKAIGFIACVSMMAASLYVFSGGDPSRMLSARTESANAEDGVLARQFMKDARQSAAQGNSVEARRLAAMAADLTTDWRSTEQTPQQFLKSLEGLTPDVTWSVADEVDWAILEPDAVAATGEQTTAEVELPSADTQQGRNLLNRAIAERFVGEAVQALKAGDTQHARTRALQAARMKIAWGLWEQKPEDILTAIDQAEGTETFLADDRSVDAKAETSVGQKQREAAELLNQARAAMDSKKFARALQLAERADAMAVQYGEFDDTPDLVRRDIHRFSGAMQQFGFVSDENIDFEQEVDRQFASAPASAAVQHADVDRDTGHPQKLSTAAAQQDQAWELLADPATVTHQDKPQAVVSANAEPNLFVVNPESLRDEGASKSAVLQANRIPIVASSDVVKEASFDDTLTADMSAEEAWQLGMAELRGGNQQAAKSAFLVAKKQIGELDGFRRQQLQDQLQELSSVRVNSVRMVAALPDDIDQAGEADPLTDAVDQHDARLQRTHAAVTNAVARAESLKDTDVEEGLRILDTTLADIESAGLAEESTQALSRYVNERRVELEAYRAQREPMIAMEERNESVRDKIERDIKHQIRIEQEVADLVQQYNDLSNQRRYAEAVLIAQKAYDLNPDLPETAAILAKSKLEKQIAFNEDVRTRSADQNLNALNDVEFTMARDRGDYLLPGITKWKEITSRRAGFGSSGRRLTESEQRIQKSLHSQVSLHFHDVPLTTIISDIANTHQINIVLDRKAIESQGLISSQTVSIDVDGIELRSALNLLLQQSGGLVYTVENEVLKITDSLEQESHFKPTAYPVADLVVPLSDKSQSGPFDNLNYRAGGSGLYQLEDDLNVQIGAGGSSRGGGASGTAGVDEFDFSGLKDMITTAVAPGTWDIDGGEGTIGVSENTLSLIIRQTPAVHDQIVELLEQLRKLQDLQVTVEVRFIAVSDDFFERIGVDFDFNVPDSLGDPIGVPAFGSNNFTLPGGGGAGGAAGVAGVAGAAGAAGAAGVGGIGGIAGAGGGLGGGGLGGGGMAGGGMAGGGMAGGGMAGGGAGMGMGLFQTVPRSNFTQDGFRRTTVGLAAPGQFTDDFDIQFQQGSFELGIPQFGNFDPTGGLSVGMAILSDLEAFFFLEAVQSDRRANVLFAPKVSVFNGQSATITDSTSRPYIASVAPVVGTGAVGFAPQIGQIQDGISLSVTAVISADRRYVRLSLSPMFNNLAKAATDAAEAHHAAAAHAAAHHAAAAHAAAHHAAAAHAAAHAAATQTTTNSSTTSTATGKCEGEDIKGALLSAACCASAFAASA